MLVIVLAEQAVVLCQVEKAKEDMLNQLYSSIRLATYLFPWWHTDDIVSHVWMHIISPNSVMKVFFSCLSMHFWCFFLCTWLCIQDVAVREQSLIVIYMFICASFHVSKCISSWICPEDIIQYNTLQLVYEHLQLQDMHVSSRYNLWFLSNMFLFFLSNWFLIIKYFHSLFGW